MSIPRIAPLVVVIVVSATIALLVLGNPWQDPPQFHSRFQGTDSFLVTTLLQLINNAVTTNPLGYYDLPILHPDPVPLRGTEPFISHTPLFLLLQLLCGGNAPLAYSLQALLCVVLLAVLSFAVLRVLDVGSLVAAMAGISTTALHWWFLFSDRLQILTLYWIPLVLLLLVLWLKSRRIVWLIVLIPAITMLVLTSLYVTLALCFAAIVVSPAIATHFWRERTNREVMLSVLSCGLATVLAAVLLFPWLSHRWDSGAYGIEDYLERKEWKPWTFDLLVHRPLESKETLISLPTSVVPYGSFPGFAVLLFSAAILWHAVRQRREQVGDSRLVTWLRRARAIGGWGWGAWALGGSFILPKEPTPLLLVGDLLLLGWLGAWISLLALQRVEWESAEERNSWMAQMFAVIGILIFSLSLGAPMHLSSGVAPVSNGVYTVAANLLPPFDLTRDLLRFILPASCFFLIALGLSAGSRRLAAGGSRIAVPLLFAMCVIAVAEVWGVQPDSRDVPEILPQYQLLERSTATGALLELPYFRWTHTHSIRRMYWQPTHGRPIADGYTGFMPAWRAPALDLYNRFPSDDCLALLRAWNIDTVLAEPVHEVTVDELPAGVHFRGELNGWRLYDLNFLQLPQLEHQQAPPQTREVMPVIYKAGGVDSERTATLTDGEAGFGSAITLAETQWMVFQTPEGSPVGMVLDFGYGVFFRIPDEIIVEARVDGAWQRISLSEGSRLIGARCADLLMNEQFARVFIPLREVNASTFRLQGNRDRWDLPEMRLVVSDEAERN